MKMLFSIFTVIISILPTTINATSHDDTQLLQDQINAVSSVIPKFGIDTFGSSASGPRLRANNSAHIELEPGRVYNIYDTLVVPPNTFIDLNNSTIRQHTVGKDIFRFSFESGNNYYSSHGNGLVNGKLDCTGKGKRGLLLDTVVRSHFSNLRIVDCDFAIVAWEVQYSTFINIQAMGSRIAGLYLTAHPTRGATFLSIDNAFYSSSFNEGAKYGVWLQAARYNRFQNTDISRNLNTDIYFGDDPDGDWAGAGSLWNNKFANTKIEHNTSDAPSSGFAVNLNYSDVRGTQFNGLIVERQGSGDGSRNRYFKWLRNGTGVIGTKVEMDTDTNIDLQDSLTGRYALWEVSSWAGLEVHYPVWIKSVDLSLMAEDKDGNIVFGDSRYIPVHQGMRYVKSVSDLNRDGVVTAADYSILRQDLATIP